MRAGRGRRARPRAAPPDAAGPRPPPTRSSTGPIWATRGCRTGAARARGDPTRDFVGGHSHSQLFLLLCETARARLMWLLVALASATHECARCGVIPRSAWVRRKGRATAIAATRAEAADAARVPAARTRTAKGSARATTSRRTGRRREGGGARARRRRPHRRERLHAHRAAAMNMPARERARAGRTGRAACRQRRSSGFRARGTC